MIKALASKTFHLNLCIFMLFSLSVTACTKQEPAGKKMPAEVSETSAELVGLPGDIVLEIPLSDGYPRIEAYINEWGTGGAFIIKTKQGSQLVSRTGVTPAYLHIDFVTISPDGKRISYVIKENEKWRLVLDKSKGELFDVIDSPVFTLDSRHIVYKARRNDRWHLVIDDRVGDEMFQVYGDPLVTPDGSTIITVEKNTKKSPFAIISYDMSFRRKVLREVDAHNLIFSDDLRRVAAVISEGEKMRVVYSDLYTDDVLHEGKLWDQVSQLNFDSTGRHITYGAKKGGRQYIVFNDRSEPLPEGTLIELPVINTAEMNVAAIMLPYKVYLHHAFLNKQQRDRKMYQQINDVQFSTDGSRTIFIGANDDKYFLTVNGKEGPRFDKAVSARLSPDGRFIAYRARQDGKRFMMIADGNGKTIRRSPDYEMVFMPRFTKDGKSLAYGVKDGNKLLWKVEKLN